MAYPVAISQEEESLDIRIPSSVPDDRKRNGSNEVWKPGLWGHRPELFMLVFALCYEVSTCYKVSTCQPISLFLTRLQVCDICSPSRLVYFEVTFLDICLLRRFQLKMVGFGNYTRVRNLSLWYIHKYINNDLHNYTNCPS